nr:retron St85 family effector protein [Xanthomonas sp. XNM01]
MDPRDDAILKLASSPAWIRAYSGFIFVCGGPVDVREQEPLSVRDALLRVAASKPSLFNRIRLAEEFKEWSVDGHYRDLRTFEEHLAELSDVIVLILESPGSLAELGLFSAMESFQRKLSVFVSSHHFDQPSFIRLGPIKYLELLENEAEVFPWVRLQGGRETVDKDWLAASAHELFDALQERAVSKNPESRFDPGKWLHRALLICNLIWLMSALTITEIELYLDLFDVKMSNEDLRQAMFILERLELVYIVARSRQRFYVAKGSSDFIRWSIKRSELDLERMQMDIARYYEEVDRKRFRAIQEVRRG